MEYSWVPLAAVGVSLLGVVLPVLVSRRNKAAQEQRDAIARDVASLEKAAAEWRSLYEDQQNQLQEAFKQIAELRELIVSQERREYAMRRDLDSVHDWIEAGCVPPPPTRPKYLSSWE